MRFDIVSAAGVLAITVTITWLGSVRPPIARAAEGGATMKVQSTSFQNEGAIPRKHTCQADDVSPELAWSEAPPGTQSFAIVVDDPDAPDPKAPKTVWVHWVLYNLPATTHTLPEGTASKLLPQGALEGLNDWKQTGYRGPCPPIGRHRYFHKVYALDVVLPDLGKPTKQALERAMKGHVLAEAVLMGTYQKGAKDD